MDGARTVLIVVAGMLLAGVGLPSDTSHAQSRDAQSPCPPSPSPTVTERVVPELRGVAEQDARDAIPAAGYKPLVADPSPSPTSPDAIVVVSQSPAPGPDQETDVVAVDLGTLTPRVEGLTFSEAISRLSDHGLTASPANEPDGLVVAEQVPEPCAVIAVGSEVVLVPQAPPTEPGDDSGDDSGDGGGGVADGRRPRAGDEPRSDTGLQLPLLAAITLVVLTLAAAIVSRRVQHRRRVRIRTSGGLRVREGLPRSAIADGDAYLDAIGIRFRPDPGTQTIQEDPT